MGSMYTVYGVAIASWILVLMVITRCTELYCEVKLHWYQRLFILCAAAIGGVFSGFSITMHMIRHM